MNHEPYRQWALQDVPLSREEQAELDQHLEVCAACRETRAAWLTLEAELERAPMVLAPAGFRDRFQERLAERRATRANRQTWLVLAGSVSIGVGLLAFMIPLLISNLATVFASLMASFVTIRLGVDLVVDLAFSVLSLLPAPIASLAGLSLAVAALGLAWAAYASMGALWAAAVYRFAISDNGGTR